MARQTVTLGAPHFAHGTGGISWTLGSSPIAIDAALTPGFARFLRGVGLRDNGGVDLDFTDVNNLPTARADLSDAFETDGGFTLVADGNRITVLMAGADTSDPYAWTPANSAEVTAFAGMFDDADDAMIEGTLTLFDVAIPTMKYNGVNISAWKYNGVEIAGAKYNGIVLQ